MERERVSIIIPAYNERDRIGSTLKDLAHFIRENPGFVGEVVVVDDGSTDATVEVVMYYCDKMSVPLRVERLFKNSGKWAAIYHGMKSASNDWVLLLDADGAASVRMLLEVPHGWELSTTAYFGSRFLEGASVSGKTWLRQVVSHGYKMYAEAWYWFATGKSDVDDLQCPFKLFRKSKVMNKSAFFVDRFAGDIELACRLNCEIVSIPIVFNHVRGSKVPISAVVTMAWETMRVAVRERALRGNAKIYK